jgi:GPH family glycoside/pentoside/hexuronide:cation symporter
MLLSMVFFFTSPQYLPSSIHITWAVVALMILNTASTVLNVPYSSLTPELTGDYHEQSSLNGYRFGCAVFGTITGAVAVQPIVSFFARPGAADPLLDPKGFSMMGLCLGSIMALVTFITFFGTKEKKIKPEDLPKDGFFRTYFSVFKNKPFVFLLMTYALHMTGITFLTTILSYYTENVLKRGDVTTIVLGILLLTAMIFIPVSVLVSKKIGKKHTYQICFMILSSACIVLFFFGHRLPLSFFYALLVYAGIGVGFSYVAPYAMVPDAIEYEAARTGQRREGSYYGMWTFISKSGTAFAIFISGLVLEAGGYISNAGESALQPATVFNAIRIIIGPLPGLALLGAIVMIGFYPLNEKTHEKRSRGE